VSAPLLVRIRPSVEGSRRHSPAEVVGRAAVVAQETVPGAGAPAPQHVANREDRIGKDAPTSADLTLERHAAIMPVAR
jgi:hypothetical protein